MGLPATVSMWESDTRGGVKEGEGQQTNQGLLIEAQEAAGIPRGQ
jgi:hypothetical protein